MCKNNDIKLHTHFLILAQPNNMFFSLCKDSNLKTTNFISMKKFIIVSLFLIFVGNAVQAQKPKTTGHEITVTIKGIPDTLLYIANYYGSNQYLKDSAKVTKNKPGTFTFKGKDPFEGGLFIIASQKKAKLLELVIDKNQKFSIESDTADLLGRLIIKNSPENEVFYSYIRPSAKYQTEIMRLQKQLKEAKEAKNADGIKNIEAVIKEKSKENDAFTKDFIAKNPTALISKVLKVNEQIDIPELPVKSNGNPDSTWGWTYYKTHYWDNIDLNDDRLLRTPVFTPKLATFFTGVLIQDNDSIIKEIDLLIDRVKNNKEMYKYVIWWVTNHYETSKIMGQDEIFVHMAEKYYAGNLCPWVTQTTVDNMAKRANQLKAILIGAKAPELIMPDTNSVFISNYAPHAKFTIMWFWDSDCGHCKIETPKLRDFYNAQKDSLGLEVYAISTDPDLARWKKYIVENKLTWINVGGNTANIDFRKVYDIYSTPVMFILDENKNIIAKRLSPGDLPDFFKQYKRMIEHKK